MKKVTVVGSGFGGLAIAIRLQALGFDVTIFEKNQRVGGHASQMVKDGYTFDLGPSLITAPSIIRSIFEAADEEMDDYLDLIPLDPFYRIYFYDGTYIDYSGNVEEMKSQIAKFNQKDSENYEKFLAYSRNLYQLIIKEGLGAEPFINISSFIKNIPKLTSTKGIFPAFSIVKNYFEDFRTQFIFSFHPLFIGGSPFVAPALYLMIPYLEKEEGVWFTKGGMYTVVEALEKVFLKNGGEIRTNSEITQIEIESNRAVAVKTKDESFPVDLVVSNAHYAHTYMDLIKPSERSKNSDKKVLSKKYSMSSFLLYIGTKKKYPQLEHHTLILAERYKGLIEDIFSETTLPEDYSMYLHAPTKTDPGMAPEGCESMYVLVPVPNLNADIDWIKEAPKYRQKILDFLQNDFGLEDLQENIEVIETFTPLDFENDRNNHLGSAWSLQPILFQSANFRPHNKSEDIENLYLVGASTHPGGGVPGVMLSAEVTENVIRKDYDI